MFGINKIRIKTLKIMKQKDGTEEVPKEALKDLTEGNIYYKYIMEVDADEEQDPVLVLGHSMCVVIEAQREDNPSPTTGVLLS